MNILDVLFGVLQISLALLVIYFLFKALLRGYSSEKKIYDLTKRVNHLQEGLDQLERQSNKSK